MSGKIITNANLISPSCCTRASTDYGAVSSKNVGALYSQRSIFFPLKIVHTISHTDTVKDVFGIFENTLKRIGNQKAPHHHLHTETLMGVQSKRPEGHNIAGMSTLFYKKPCGGRCLFQPSNSTPD